MSKAKTMGNFTFTDGLILAIDLKRNNAMCGRDRLKQLTGLSDNHCKKIIGLINAGFADYFFSKKRSKSFIVETNRSPLKDRLINIHHSDIQNFKTL